MYSYQSTETIEAGLARLSELKARLDSRGPLPRIWLGRTRRELEAEAVSRLHSPWTRCGAYSQVTVLLLWLPTTWLWSRGIAMP
jgi:hypothetical protein